MHCVSFILWAGETFVDEKLHALILNTIMREQCKHLVTIEYGASQSKTVSWANKPVRL